MNINNFSEMPTKDESLKDSVRVTKKAEDAVKLIEKGGSALYESTYKDQMRPDYICFGGDENGKKLQKEFEELLDSIEKRTEEWITVGPRLEEIATIDFVPDDLRWVFKDGKWAIPPKDFLWNADAAIQQDEDEEWFTRQREHFANQPEPDPLGKQSEKMQIDAESYEEPNE